MFRRYIFPQSSGQETSRNRRQATTGLIGLLFDSEDGRDVFLRNVGLSQEYMALQLRRLHSTFVI
jgi:hypothetical protein